MDLRIGLLQVAGLEMAGRCETAKVTFLAHVSKADWGFPA
jgi:hypothetical protein